MRKSRQRVIAVLLVLALIITGLTNGNLSIGTKASGDTSINSDKDGNIFSGFTGDNNTGWKMFSDNTTSASIVNSKAEFNLNGNANANWATSLCQIVPVETNQDYTLSFKVDTDMQKDVKIFYDGQEGNTQTITVPVGEGYEVGVTVNTSGGKNIMISVANSEQTASHTVKIYDLCLLPKSEINPSTSPANNLISNGDFTNGEDNWTIDTNATSGFNKSVSGNILTLEDVLFQNEYSVISDNVIEFESGRDYIISFDVLSERTRDVVCKIINDSDGSDISTDTISVTGNIVKKVNFSFTANDNYTGQLGLFFETDLRVVDPYNIKIANVAVEAAPANVPENMLTNGSLKNDSSGWNIEQQGATATHKSYAMVFNVNQNMADWQQNINQVVSSVNVGTKYVVYFDVLTSVPRTVTFGFDGNRDFTSALIPANQKTTVRCEVNAATQKFMIYLGTNVGPHTVEISNLILTTLADDPASKVTITSFDPISEVSAGSAYEPEYANAEAVKSYLLNTYSTVTGNTNTKTIPVLAWNDTDSFNPNVTGSYTFTATFDQTVLSSEKVTLKSGVKATVEVVVTDTDITKFDTVTDVLAGIAGSVSSTLNTSQKVITYLNSNKNTVSANNGKITNIPVTNWTDKNGNYDPTVPNDYIFEAVIGTLPNYSTNTNSLKATVKVVVSSNNITRFEELSYDAGVAKSAKTLQEVQTNLLLAHATISANSGALTGITVTGWTDTDGYNPDVAGSYTFTGTIGSLGSATNTNNILPTIEVVVNKINIISFDTIEEIDGGSNVTPTYATKQNVVDYLMAEHPNLQVTTSNTTGGTYAIPVTSWNCSNYDSEIAGTYTFTPVFDTTNLEYSGLVASALVKIKDGNVIEHNQTKVLGNIIQNTSFASGTNWLNFDGDNYDNGIFTTKSTDGKGAAHTPSLIYEGDLSLINGKTYEFEFDVLATETRTIKAFCEWGDGANSTVEMIQVNKDKLKHVKYQKTISGGNASRFGIFMGNVAGETNLSDHTIKIANLSVVNLTDKPTYIKTFTTIDTVYSAGSVYDPDEDFMSQFPMSLSGTSNEKSAVTNIPVKEWTSQDFNKDEAGTYTFTASFDSTILTNNKLSIMEDTSLPTIKVKVSETDVIAIDEIDNLGVGIAGSVDSDYEFVSDVISYLNANYTKVTANDGKITDIDVNTWSQASGTNYDSNTAGEYVFEATVTMPNGATNTLSKKAEIIVFVSSSNITSFDKITSFDAGNVGNVKSLQQIKSDLLTAHNKVSANSTVIKDIEIDEWVSPSDFDANTAGDYTFTGKIKSIPTGITNTDNLQPTLTVTINKADITLFDALDDVQAGDANHPLFANAGEAIAYLNGTYTNVLANNSQFTIPVSSWQEEDTYDYTQAGSYTFKAVLGTLPHNAKNTSGLTAKIKVVIDGVPEVDGNMLNNGNLAPGLVIDTLGDKNDIWQFANTGASVTAKDYKVVFDITNSNVDQFQQGMFQNVTAVNTSTELNKSYTISFDVLSTVNRSITFGFDNKKESPALLEANKKQTVTYTVTTPVSKKFFIYVGLGGTTYANVGAHKVEISNVQLKFKPVDLPNDKNDTLPAPITSVTGQMTDYSILKNGYFTDGSNGMNNWLIENVDWMWQYNVVKYSKVKNGVKVWITEIGDGTAQSPHDAKFSQTVSMKKDKAYTISFDVHSEKARSIKVLLAKGSNVILEKTVAIQDDETRHVSFNIPVQKNDTNADFSILMGSVERRNVKNNNMIFSNMKIEVNGFSNYASLINDGNFNNDLGEFTVNGTVVANADDTTKSIEAEVIQSGDINSASISRAGLNLLANQAYDISFVSGARTNRDAKVQILDSVGNVLSESNIELTQYPKTYSMQFTPASNYTNASLRIIFGGAEGNVYFDTIRMDITGYTKAMSINVNDYDFTGLTRSKSPIISNDTVERAIGEDITLTFNDNPAFRDEIEGIYIDGTKITDMTKYTITAGQIKLDSSLFTFTDSNVDRQIYTIIVKAAWYEDAIIKQTIFPQTTWKLTWSDEFNDTQLDLTKWSYQDGTGAEYGLDGWGNNEQQYYTKNNVIEGNGVLTFKATKNETLVKNKPYSSGRIWTMNDDGTIKFAQTYGKFEARMKLPAMDGAQGMWPAFWLLPATQEYGGWPLSGEIDIMEARGREPYTMDGTIHFGQPWPNNQAVGGHYVWQEGEGSINDYHTYSVEWQPGEIRWYMDDILFYKQNNFYSLPSGSPTEYAYPAPFDQPFYIILNLAVGGTYDNNRLPDDSIFPTEMNVDYVRVYEYTGTYEEPVKPTLEKETIPANAKQPNANGDYIVDSGFNNVTIVDKDEVVQSTTGWNFATLPQFGGIATLTKVYIDGKTLAKIDVANVGTASYAIQLMQNVPLVKGRYYKVSFDAKAAATRELSMKFGDIGDDGWSTYGSYTPKLSTEVEHYEYIFQMGAATDITSRIECNFGGDKTTVWIGNLSFVEVENNNPDNNVIKKPLDSGNHIYNGSFDLGTGRLIYWNNVGFNSDTMKALKSPTSGYELNLITSDTLNENINQQGIELLQSDTYLLKFKASSSVERTIDVLFTNADGSISYAQKTINLDNTLKEHSLEFTMPGDSTDKNSKVTFIVGGAASTIVLDNIVLTRETNRNVDFSNVNCYPLINGDFEEGLKGWTTYGTSLSLADNTVNGLKAGKVLATGNSANNYDNMLIYPDLSIYGGFTYKLSFKAKATKNATVSFCMEDSGYNKHLANTNISLTTEWKTFSFEPRFSSNVNLALKFLLGATGGDDYSLFIDDVIFEMKGAPNKPGTMKAAEVFNYISEDVVLNYTGDKTWMDLTEYYVDGILVDKSKVTIEDEAVILDGSLFTQSKVYNISVRANDYANVNLKVKLYNKDGNMIINGSFNNGLNGWETYAIDECADLTIENGYLKVHSKHKGLSSGSEVTWSVQLIQEAVQMEKGEKYQLSFVGYSTVDRQIVFEGINNGNAISLTTTPKLYTVEFTANTFESTFKFLMGTVGGIGNVDHSIYLDNISIKLKSAISDDEPGDDKILSAPMNVFLNNVNNGVLISILPAINAPVGVEYVIYYDGEEVKRTTETSFTYETKEIGEHTIGVVAVKTGYTDSQITNVKVLLTDTFAPELPIIKADAGTNKITITVTKPNDNVGVAGYIVYLDGDKIDNKFTTEKIELTEIEAGTHIVRVAAYDEAGNISAQSQGKFVVVTAPGENPPVPQNPTGNNETGNQTVTPATNISNDWTSILDKILLVSDKDNKGQTITIKENAVLPKEILENMIDKNIDLVIDMKEYKWIIKSNSIESGKMDKEYSLNIKNLENDKEVVIIDNLINKAKSAQKLEKVNVLKEFEIEHNGDFPFKAQLVLPMELKYVNKYVYVYYINEKSQKLELVGVSKPNYLGDLTVNFTHASKYVITEEALIKPSAATKQTIYTKLGDNIKLSNIADGTVITYKSSNTSVVTVNKNGLLVGKKKGSAKITTTIMQGGKTYKLTTTVTVKDSVFKFDKTTNSLKVGKSFTFKVINLGYPSSITWSVSDKELATITKTGKVTAKAAGDITVFATVDGKTIFMNVKIKK